MSDEDLQARTALTRTVIDGRVRFQDDLQIMEVDFSDLHLACSADVNAFYDRIEERVAETGEDLWFFMVNYSGSRIDPGAWFAFSRRGKVLNKAHSMGSVRFDASDATRRQIERDAGTEKFDANLLADRDSAIERLKSLPSKRRKKIVHQPNYTREENEARVSFIPDEQIFEIDLSDIHLQHSRDVNDIYDVLEAQIEATGQRWFFLINYNNCRIDSSAWVQWAKRGKAFNIGGSLGTVRYEAGSETEADIRLRAETQGFRPNIRNTREEALQRIAEMKTETAG
ncbi:MAG: hypothetical protein GY717_14805 [Rhodobacteraceae bacterium]|nr:hypothetical protein [Paracoccaceae bacterium]